MTLIERDMLERLRAYDTPTICNLVELFDVRPRNQGFMDERIRACFDDLPPAVGFAATATFRSSAPPRSGDVYASMEHQVEQFEELGGPAFVVFQDIDSPTVSATFGEVMCTVYKAFGAVGLITSGAGRDLDQVRAIDFPAWTNGTISAHGYCHTLQTQIPVHVGGLTIYPNDLLHADRNGVTTIPPEIVGEMVDIAEDFVAAERVILEGLTKGTPTVKLLRELRAESQAQIAALHAQVSRSPRL